MTARTTVAEETIGLGKARQELELEPAEFELALQLGEVATTPAEGGGRGVRRTETERLRAEEGFPDGLRERLRVVGAISGAELMGISRDRFARLARGGLIHPVRWYVNRYRQVVWLYLADELRRYAAANQAVLTGRLPAALRRVVEEGEDHRARTWRTRRVAQLVRDAADAWDEAAVWAALLGPVAAAEAVPELDERDRLRRLCSGLPRGNQSPSLSPETLDTLVTATHPDEIAFARLSLADALDRARAERPAPRPTDELHPADEPRPADEPSAVGTAAGRHGGERPRGHGRRRLLGIG
jgi:hypothetical protein